MPGAADVTAALAARAREAGRIAIDTEFMGEGRYRSLLCLVQVAVEEPDGGPGGEPWIELLDPLAPEPPDPAPIIAVLNDPAVEVVMHAGRQDVAVLRRTWGAEITNLFDTQVAAGFAGFGAQTGYGGLLSGVLKVQVAKSATFTRWDVRPLTPEQLEYAREDVLHLLELADGLQRRLRDRGRLEWAREECRAIEAVTDERDPERAYERLPRTTQLRPRERAVAKELAAWRERAAAAEDKPVSSIIPDAALVELARRQPRAPEELRQIRGLQPRTAKRRAEDVIAAVERGREAEPIRLEDERRAGDARHAPLIALAESLVRARALAAGLAYELVASRADLGPIVRSVREGEPEPDVRTLRGWRRELVGAELLEVLAGERTLAVGPDGGIEAAPA